MDLQYRVKLPSLILGPQSSPRRIHLGLRDSDDGGTPLLHNVLSIWQTTRTFK